jgi:hypothetical protein
MSTVDDFLKQAGAHPAQAKPLTAVQQFAAQAQGPQASEQGAGQPGILSQIGRGVGLTARAAVTGVTGIPALVGDGLNTALNLGADGVNWATGSNIPHLGMPSQVIQHAEDKVFPTPRDGTERVVQDAAGAGFGLNPTLALGKALSKSAAPVAQGIGRTLTAVPGNQVIAAATSGTAAGGAREAGLAPGWQLAAGLVGGVAGSLGGAGLGSIGARAKNMVSPPAARPELAVPAVESALGSSPLPASPERTATVQFRTKALLANAPAADPASAARAADASQLGMKLTLGQQTRDPGLFAQEQNWRGLPAGRQLLSKFSSQNGQLAAALDNAAGAGGEPYKDGKAIIGTLSGIDDSMRSQIGSAYKAAEQSSGAKFDVPLHGVAQDYAQVLHNFGDKVPSGVRNNFDALGLQGGTQRKVFGIDDAESLLKNINANRGIDPATNAALGQLTASVKNAILTADDQGGVFAQPRQMAAQRFSLHDNVPALADASAGKIAPEDFTRKYLMNGDVDHVKALADLLAQHSPDTLGLVRGQVGNELKQAAFGINAAGDKSFAPERFGAALKNFGGTEKLSALYGPEATDDIYTVGRVGSYIHSEPNFSPVNRSNTGSAVLDMASGIPMVGSAISAIGKRAMIARALRGELSDTGMAAETPATLQDSLILNAARPTPIGQGQ